MMQQPAAAPADDQSNDYTVEITCHADGTFSVSDDTDDAGGDDQMAMSGADAGGEPAEPQGQLYQSLPEALKAARDMIQQHMGAGAQDSFMAGAGEQSTQLPKSY